VDNGEGQAVNGGDQHCCCGDKNEPLVHGRIRAGAKGKKDERPKKRIRVHTGDLQQTNDEFEKKHAKFCEDLRALRKVRLEKLKEKRI
jgi:hypothetical protein